MAAETALPVGTRLPIIFSYRDVLFGNGFVVEVHAVNGRALCVAEGDGVWMYGVHPGAMAARGEDVESAHAAFRQMFSDVLKDLASETSSFEDFRLAVTAFFDDGNDGYAPEWEQAVRELRAGRAEPFEGMKRAAADAPRSIAVTIKATFSSEDNQPALQPALAA